jgi:hypothetical protein
MLAPLQIVEGACSSCAALGLSVCTFGITEILTSGESGFSSMLSNFHFNSILSSLILSSVDVLVIT